MEAKIDDAIGRVLGLINEYKRVLIGLAVVCLAIFWRAVFGWVTGQVDAVMEAVHSGMGRYELATALGVGVVGGLGPPGATVSVGHVLGSTLAGVVAPEHPIQGATLVVALACNALLTPVDLICWQRVWSALGTRIWPGGRYIRPFLAGFVPYALCSPLIFLAVYQAAALLPLTY